MSKSQSFNELSSSLHAVWSKLALGVDPARWAWLCRRLGQMSRDEFERFCRQTEAQLSERLPTDCSQFLKDRKNQDNALPLVSIGPSGLGGLYQKEIKLKARQVCSVRSANTSGKRRLDLWA